MKNKFLKEQIKDITFQENFKKIIDNLKEKKITVITNLESFKILNKNFKITNKLNISSILIEDFKDKTKKYKNIDVYNIATYEEKNYDEILIINNDNIDFLNYITSYINKDNKPTTFLFEENYKDEIASLNYLYNLDIKKNYEKIVSKLKNKKVILYGTGLFFNTIQKVCDLSKLNIIGISDKKYESEDKEKEFQGYKTIAPNEIKDYKPDYVLITTRKIVIIKNFLDDLLLEEKTKIDSIPHRNLIEILKEVCEQA